jgi:formate dehydrogenase assembly factor FdhD
VFDIEEVEYSMSDIEESENGQFTAQKDYEMGIGYSLKESVIHQPKDFPYIYPSGKINENSSNVSNLSY